MAAAAAAGKGEGGRWEGIYKDKRSWEGRKEAAWPRGPSCVAAGKLGLVHGDPARPPAVGTGGARATLPSMELALRCSCCSLRSLDAM